MKLDALKRQGVRTDLTSDQVGQKCSRKTSRDIIADGCSDSSTQVQWYLRLNTIDNYPIAYYKLYNNLYRLLPRKES